MNCGAVAKAAPKRLTEYLSVLKTHDDWWLMGLYSVTFGGFSGLGEEAS